MPFNYNDPIDDINVVSMKIPYAPFDSYEKAFQLKPGIYVLPQAMFDLDSGDTADSWLNFTRYNSIETKQEFLNTISDHLEDISRGRAGKTLLDAIENLKPLPVYYEGEPLGGNLIGYDPENTKIAYFDTEEGYFDIATKEGKNRKVGHVIIMGLSPGAIANGIYNQQKMQGSVEGYGRGMGSMISIDPAVTGKVMSTGAIIPSFGVLAHELCHSFQVLIEVEKANTMFYIEDQYHGPLRDKEGNIIIDNFTGREKYPVKEVRAVEVNVTNPAWRDFYRRIVDVVGISHAFDYWKYLLRRIDYLDSEVLVGFSDKANVLRKRLDYRIWNIYYNFPTEVEIIADSLTAKGYPIDYIQRFLRGSYLDFEGPYKVESLELDPSDSKIQKLNNVVSCDLIHSRKKRSITAYKRSISKLISCIPSITSQPANFVEKDSFFKDVEINELRRNSIKVVNEFLDSQKNTDQFKPYFVNSFKSAEKYPRAKIINFKNSVEVLNRGLTSVPMDVFEFYGWCKSLIEVFKSDADNFTKTASALGIVPIVGDLLGIADALRKEDYNAVASQIALLAVLGGAVVIGGPIGLTISAIIGIIFLGIYLKDLIEGIIHYFAPRDLNEEVQKYTRLRDRVWKSDVVKKVKEQIIPEMESSYRVFETQVRESLEISINLILKNAEEAKNAEKDLNIKNEIMATACGRVEEMYYIYDEMLKDVAGKTIRDCKEAVYQLVKEYHSHNYEKNSKDILEQYKKDYVAQYISWKTYEGTLESDRIQNRKEGNERFETIKSRVSKIEILKDQWSWLDECFQGKFWPDLIFSLPLLHIDLREAQKEQYALTWDLPDLPEELLALLRVEAYVLSKKTKIPSYWISTQMKDKKTDHLIPITDSWDAIMVYIKTPTALIGEHSYAKVKVNKNGDRYVDIEVNGRKSYLKDYLLPVPYNEYLFQYASSSLSLSSSDGSLIQEKYTSKGKQRWIFRKFRDNFYMIINAETKNKLTSNLDGTIGIQSGNIEENQAYKWEVVLDDEGYIKFRSGVYPDRFIGLADHSQTFSLVPDGKNCLFNLIKADAGRVEDKKAYTIFSEYDNRCITSLYASNSTSLPLGLWSLTSHPSQVWLANTVEESLNSFSFSNIFSNYFIRNNNGKAYQNSVVKIPFELYPLGEDSFLMFFEQRTCIMEGSSKEDKEGWELIAGMPSGNPKEKILLRRWRFGEFPSPGIYYNIVAFENFRKIKSDRYINIVQGDQEVKIESYQNRECLFRFEKQEAEYYFIYDSMNNLLTLSPIPGNRTRVSPKPFSKSDRNKQLWKVTYDDERKAWRIINKEVQLAIQAEDFENQGLKLGSRAEIDSGWQSWLIVEPEAFGLETEKKYVATIENGEQDMVLSWDESTSTAREKIYKINHSILDMSIEPRIFPVKYLGKEAPFITMLDFIFVYEKGHYKLFSKDYAGDCLTFIPDKDSTENIVFAKESQDNIKNQIWNITKIE
ncbi:hypothetical protein IQ37_18705 [Chryseobacterium piperi]|uniref:Uncharacterized protein n=1 Tax=Chryseobacterium piperi TaxID=558152 RepID=A0A086AF40_9FLAO|nr:hypothetical protein [Chryseobacterium piperi]ASW73945.2 hypothetical protein CJF12_06335 [Chryseobacterium piperi]KFF15304.1 hypothetical protein IQ37_18705 [Chryseobacterium piperi]